MIMLFRLFLLTLININRVNVYPASYYRPRVVYLYEGRRWQRDQGIQIMGRPLQYTQLTTLKNSHKANRRIIITQW